jgi:DNA-binding Xre family transcriptional regulator
MTPDELDAWEEGLRRWEAELAARAAQLERLEGNATALPAAPVVSVLLHVVEDRHVASLDAGEVAAGLGLERSLVRDLLAGEREHLPVEDVKAVCEALHCSPFDLWPPEDARAVLGSYPPETWPRYIEPLDDLYEPGASEFVVRRVAQLADELAGHAARGGLVTPEVTVAVTPYRQTGVMAVDPSSGVTKDVTDVHGPAERDVDYFFAFAQLRRPMEVALADPLPREPPPGEDAPPALVAAAERIAEWTPQVSMLRFTDTVSGAEHWLGLDPVRRAWQSWDDPAFGYPGLRTDVLDSAGHLDPSVLLDDGLSLDSGEGCTLEPSGLDVS